MEQDQTPAEQIINALRECEYSINGKVHTDIKLFSVIDKNQTKTLLSTLQGYISEQQSTTITEIQSNFKKNLF